MSTQKFAKMRALTKGDIVQRGDRSFEMDTRGFLLGVRCLGQTIRKENGGWFRTLPNTRNQPTP